MKYERILLIAFFGNYLINNVVAGLASLIPSSGPRNLASPQYITFAVLAALCVAAFTYWFFYGMKKTNLGHTPHVVYGAIFGASGFVLSILTVFVSGIAGVLIQTGSVAQLMSILPNFGPYLANWTTLVLAAFWVIPAAAMGWYLDMKR